MTTSDLEAVWRLADALHPDHPERPEVFAERLVLAPEGCLVLAGPEAGLPGGVLAGFVLSHPWAGPAPPALDTLLGALPAPPDRWHLHDIALGPAARGQGHVATALAWLAALAAARGIGTLGLVAVGGTERLWARFGFRPEGVDPGEPGLASYGGGAIPMRVDASR